MEQRFGNRDFETLKVRHGRDGVREAVPETATAVMQDVGQLMAWVVESNILNYRAPSWSSSERFRKGQVMLWVFEEDRLVQYRIGN